jgi:hypothetical protein
MLQSVFILDGEGADRGAGHGADAPLRDCFLRDTLELVAGIPATRVRPIEAGEASQAMATALNDGPALLLRGDVPHVPIWRLRDAFTYLGAGIDAVIGPAEDGSWYLVGLSAGRLDLHPALPIADPNLSTFVAAIRAAGRTVVALPAWYRLTRPADLDRLAEDLRPMPNSVAIRTRSFLGDDGLHARAVGE